MPVCLQGALELQSMRLPTGKNTKHCTAHSPPGNKCCFGQGTTLVRREQIPPGGPPGTARVCSLLGTPCLLGPRARLWLPVSLRLTLQSGGTLLLQSTDTDSQHKECCASLWRTCSGSPSASSSSCTAVARCCCRTQTQTHSTNRLVYLCEGHAMCMQDKSLSAGNARCTDPDAEQPQQATAVAYSNEWQLT